MEITQKLKSWLTSNQLVGEAASEEDCKTAVIAALESGKLSPAKLAELSEEETSEPDLTDVIGKAVSDAIKPLAEKVARIEAKAAKQIEAETKAPQAPEAGEKAASILQGAAEAVSMPRLKSPVEGYSASRTAAYHPEHAKCFPGQRATYVGKPLDHPSHRDLAVSAAYFKWLVNCNANGANLPRQWRMTDHDKHLVEYAMHEMPFSGWIADRYEVRSRVMTDFERKTLLDDATSGGQEAVPDVFDEAVILTPQLYGELFPIVDVQPIARGSAVDGFSIGNPTVGYTAEGGAMSEFTTTSMIAAFDTTIFPAVGAITLGLDFASDSPVDIGALLVRLYGEAFMAWLDNQIVNGDGTTEPTGVLLSTGPGGTDIGNPAGGDGAAPQVDDYETLMFTVAKQYQPPQDRERCVFIGNSTTYRRCRAIKVGTSDARRVFGMTHRDYMVLEAPFKIENNVGNNLCGYYNMRFYRMYRRLGMQVRVETAGSTLALSNEQLIVVRQRWGGKLELNAAGAYSNNFQA